MIMLNAQDSQFKIQDDGRIFYQENPTNPLPGVAIASIIKGDTILSPGAALLPESGVGPDQTAAVLQHLQQWLARHITQVLEPLMALKDCAELKDPAKAIAQQTHEALGILPREQVEDLIAALDQEDRRALRAKSIRLGPILVFIPALNKPAAVRLRALLWGLYHDHSLPVACPKDGIVSFAVDPEAIDKNFYRSVGYPVFGSRAVRIDMLDRVISAVYDSAKEGKFQAQHQMAEWLGCTIDGLYEILEAMGHKKIQHEQPEPQTPSAGENPESKSEDAAAPAVQVKPVLAQFYLKKGKAFSKTSERRTERPQPGFKKKPKSDQPERSQRPVKDKRAKSAKPQKSEQPRVISTGPQPRLEDSPFAILGQLKKKSDGS